MSHRSVWDNTVFYFKYDEKIIHVFEKNLELSSHDYLVIRNKKFK